MTHAEVIYLFAGLALGIVFSMAREVGEGDRFNGLAFMLIASWLIVGATAGLLFHVGRLP